MVKTATNGSFEYLKFCLSFVDCFRAIFISDRRMGEALLRQVNEAVSLLSEYNARLVSEMSERKKVGSLLRDFIQAQRGLLIQAENRSQVGYKFIDGLMKNSV